MYLLRDYLDARSHQLSKQKCLPSSSRYISLNLLMMLAFGAIICSSWIVDLNNPVVHTQFGSIRGKVFERKTRFNRKPICSFISIPYARPPTGANRFLPPLEPDAWQSLDATSKRVMCPQTEQRFRIALSSSEPIDESEDCLYLNIYVPADRATPVINYPVIVYIHGGEFKHGSKDHYSPEYLLDHGLILVTINYRLGVLANVNPLTSRKTTQGFLSTNDMAAPGNLGLYDQIAALRWVKQNIQSFGGNSADITVFGHDAGAVSTSLLLLAPHETQGLIQKAIIVGGSALSPVAIQWTPQRQAAEFARELNCNDKRSDKLISCLRVRDWRSLIAVARKSHDFERNQFRFWFRPVVDQNSTFSLIRDRPLNLYARGEFLRVPLMAGVSSSEGSLEYFLNYHQLRPRSSLERMRFLISPYLHEFARAEIVATTLAYQYTRRLNSTGMSLFGGSQFAHQSAQVALSSIPVASSSLETALSPALTMPLATRLTQSANYWHEQNLGIERNDAYDVYISPNDFKSKQVAREIDAIGDFLHTAPIIKSLELHSEFVSQTYLFVFDYKGAKSFGNLQLNPYGRAITSSWDNGELLSNGWLPSAPSSSGAILSSESSNFGVAHCDDLFYVLPNDFCPPLGDLRMSANGVLAPNDAFFQLPPQTTSTNSNNNPTADDNLIQSYVTFLASFAQSITEAKAANNLANWLPFRASDRNYMRFGGASTAPTLFKNFHQNDVAFVNELVYPVEELVATPLPLYPYEDLRDYKVSTAALGALLVLLVLVILLMLLLLLRKRLARQAKPLPATSARDYSSTPTTHTQTFAAAESSCENSQRPTTPTPILVTPTFVHTPTVQSPQSVRRGSFVGGGGRVNFGSNGKVYIKKNTQQADITQ